MSPSPTPSAAPHDGDREEPTTGPTGGSGTVSRAKQWMVRPRPVAVWCVVVALALEGLALVGAVVVGLLRLLPGQDHVVSVSVALVVSAAAGAWLLLACAVGAGSGRSWVRGPALTVQVLLALVGVSFLQGGATGLGLGCLLVGVAVLTGILSPPVTQFTGRRTYSVDQD